MATLSINGHTFTATPELSLFDHAESAGIRVPASCRKQGKCKECMVEIVEGADCLTPRTEFEEHLKGAFRLSCQAHPSSSEGHIRCHTMRRGAMQIESGRSGIGLPACPRAEGALRTPGRPRRLPHYQAGEGQRGNRDSKAAHGDIGAAGIRSRFRRVPR